MPINVQYNAPASQTGTLALKGGIRRGAWDRNVELERRRAQQRQLNERKRQFNTTIRYRGEQAEANRQANADSATQAQEARTKAVELGSTLGRQDAEFEQRLEQENIDYGYTAKQEAEFQQLTAALDHIEKSEDYRPEEKLELRRQMQEKMLGFKKQPSLKSSKHPKGKDVGDIWTSDDGGLVLTRNKDGEIKKIGESKTGPPTNNDRIAAWAAAREALQNELTGFVPKPEQVRELARQILILDKDGSSPAGVGSAISPDALSPDDIGMDAVAERYGLTGDPAESDGSVSPAANARAVNAIARGLGLEGSPEDKKPIKSRAELEAAAASLSKELGIPENVILATIARHYDEGGQ